MEQENTSNINDIIQKYPLKLVLVNLGKQFNEKDVLQFMQKYLIENKDDEQQENKSIKSIYKEKRQNYAVIEFNTNESKQYFVKQYNSPENLEEIKTKHYVRIFDNSDIEKCQKYYPLQGRTVDRILRVQEKSKQYNQNKEKKQLTEEEIQAEEKISLVDSVCPYYKFEYKKQVDKKRSQFKEMILKWKKEANFKIKGEVQAPRWLVDKSQPPLSDFIQCEEKHRDHYRNTVNFSCGKDLKGNITIGYPKGDIKKGTSHVSNGQDIPSIPEISKVLANLFQDFLRDLQGQEDLKDIQQVFDKYSNSGFWKKMSVKSSSITKQILINFVVFNQQQQVSENSLNIAQQKLVQYFVESQEIKNQLGEYSIVSLNMQQTDKFCDKIQTDEKIINFYGNSYYEEKILDKAYRISAQSFLQQNTEQCNQLYALIQNLISLDDETILLDICSGIGTIGISQSEQCKKVIGIEMVESSCQNALENCKINNVQNYEVICQKVENVLKQKVQEIQQENPNSKIIAVLDPPRPGVHKSVVMAIRKCEFISSVIYVACSPNSVIENLNFLTLPESNRRQGKPFTPVQCYGLDLFPHTEHYEAVFKLEREKQ